mgnify:CR=1 FL=1
MQACRIAAASDAAALRKCDGGKRPLPPAGEAIALKIASAMTAIALTALPPPPEEEAEEAGGGDGAASPSTEGAASPSTEGAAGLDDCGKALARAFVAGKRDVCTESLAALAERIKTVRAGGAKAAVRGANAKQVKAGAGKRPKAKARPKASGFG